MRNTLLLLAGCSIATCLTTSAQYKPFDYDTPSYVQFSNPRYEVSASETNAVVTVVRTGDYRKQAAVEFTTREGTAEDGVDFQATGGKIVFMAGQSFRNITVPILRDSEPVAKSFAVELTAADPFTIVVTASAEVEIKPQPPALAITVKAGALIVSWPETASSFILEAQVDGAWSAVSAPAALENGQWNVPINASAPVALFRLRAQATASAQ